MLPRVFVYGTLMPGHLRWGLVAPYAVSHQPAEVDGVLYDTGRGWPAARFRRPLGARPIAAGQADLDAHTRIPGWLVELAPSATDDLLAQLDEVEGAVVDDVGVAPPARPPGLVSGDYRRVRVETADGAEAWAYEAAVVGPDWTAVERWTSTDER